MMTLDNENPFQTTAKTSSSSPYLEFTILLWTSLSTYLPHNFFEKVWLEDTLPTYSLDISPKFRSFFIGPSPKENVDPDGKYKQLGANHVSVILSQ